jgi:hypothetical protein
MSKRVVVLLAVLMCAMGASADTLHGYCVAAACTDNGTITPTNDNPPHSAFNYAGNLKNGNAAFLLIGLVPDNYKTAPGDPTFSVGSGAVPQGTVFLAALTTAGAVTVDTPNSPAILNPLPPVSQTVPEPGTLALLGSGIFGIKGILRRKIKL